MPRGKGVKLQSYREGGLRDAMVFAAEEGPAWTDRAGRTRAWPEWRDWLGRRAAAGELAPKGFPASRRFRPELTGAQRRLGWRRTSRSTTFSISDSSGKSAMIVGIIDSGRRRGPHR